MRKDPNGAEEKPGPKPEVLVIEGKWTDAVKHALKRGKPPAEPKKRSTKKKRRTPK